jgi:hypothetical protein
MRPYSFDDYWENLKMRHQDLGIPFPEWLTLAYQAACLYLDERCKRLQK